MHFTTWGLGFKQSSLDLIAQALRSVALHVFEQPPLHRQAVVPSSFRIQVGRFASESSTLSSGWLSQQFRPCVTWRTLSKHPALHLSVQLGPHGLSVLRVSPTFMELHPLRPLVSLPVAGNIRFRGTRRLPPQFGHSDRLPPFALWPAFPASDYYGGSDAPFVSPADCWPPYPRGLSRS
jgi:hypothetical protein